jgi:hypothetical protein
MMRVVRQWLRGWARALLVGSCASMLVTSPLTAQESWLIVPVLDGRGDPRPDLALVLAPWEQELSRAVHNENSRKVFEQRHSRSALIVGEETRKRADVAVDRALRQLALGDADASNVTLKVVTDLAPLQREHLLHDNSFAQKLFNACVMRAYLFERQEQHAESKEQLWTCARRFPSFAGSTAFSPKLYGPPELQAKYDKIRDEYERSHTGTLTVSTGDTRCTLFVDGLRAGETPARIPRHAEMPTNVQVDCAGALGRIHQVEAANTAANLTIDPRFDAVISTEQHLQLRYASRAQRDAFVAKDAKRLQQLLGVDHVALLSVHAASSGWTVELFVPDGKEQRPRSIGELAFSEVAGYEPRRLRQLVTQLSPSEHEQSQSPAIVSLSEPPLPVAQPVEAPDAAMNLENGVEASPGAFPFLGVAVATVGVVGLAASWALFVERRAYRLREWNEVDATATDGYARRGAWTVAAATAGAAALTLSAFLLTPEAADVPVFAWVLGGVGLAGAAVGLGLAFADEHCGPEISLPLREPCLSVRADAIFGIEIALTALPLVSLPIAYFVRSRSTGVALTIGTGSVAISGALQVGRL